eukprot:TRINITY_DN2402_c0_g2_i2.p1 TRINITY_DN2402_c0_g2~~TRINITY_DN2402_c0_g2_i2.p1  ORF type:complete len:143 (+),score=18.51 TRINITY_DN2402_c0_g2_i2:310-738(+)
MGRVHIESLVCTIEREIEQEQEKAKQLIQEIVLNARKNDPLFFQIPYNPFSSEESSFCDMFDVGNNEDDHAKLWLIHLRKAAEISPTAQKILTVRKNLCLAVQSQLDEFKLYAGSDSIMHHGNVFAPLYCRLLMLENFLLHL